MGLITVMGVGFVSLFYPAGENTSYNSESSQSVQAEAVVREYLSNSPHEAFSAVYEHLEKLGTLPGISDRSMAYQYFHDNVEWEVSLDRQGFSEGSVPVDVYLNINSDEVSGVDEFLVPIWVYVEFSRGRWQVSYLAIDN